jgi:hypothetical protein
MVGLLFLVSLTVVASLRPVFFQKDVAPVPVSTAGYLVVPPKPGCPTGLFSKTQSGDTLQKLADYYQVTVTYIQTLNPTYKTLTAGLLLPVGVQICVPPPPATPSPTNDTYYGNPQGTTAPTLPKRDNVLAEKSGKIPRLPEDSRGGNNMRPPVPWSPPPSSPFPFPTLISAPKTKKISNAFLQEAPPTDNLVPTKPTIAQGTTTSPGSTTTSLGSTTSAPSDSVPATTDAVIYANPYVAQAGRNDLRSARSYLPQSPLEPAKDLGGIVIQPAKTVVGFLDAAES